MPSKAHWTLNPRKWFGSISNAARKRDKKTPANNSVAPLPSSITAQKIPSTLLVPRILIPKNKTKVTPAPPINDNNYRNSTHALASFTQFQLPPFNARREKTPILFNRTNVFLPTPIEPSIRKTGQFKQEISIDRTRWNTETTVYDISKSLASLSLSSLYGNSSQRNSIEKESEINISNQCLVDYPQDSSNDFIEKSPSPTRSRLSSSIDDNDGSSSSGIFTDERADLNDGHHSGSKDTLDILSIESIGDSQTSLNHCQSRPLIHRYQSPLPTFETINNKSSQLQCQTPIARTNRSHSAENILKHNQTPTPIIIRNRQASAAIVKKIEKRIPTSRSPPVTLEKAGLVRISNAKYRLATDKDEHLYHRQRQNSIIQCSNYEDSLPPAENEESYSTLPRTSSTDQLNNNIQNDLRDIVEDYLRPIVSSINQTTSQSAKTHHRSKRSQTNNEHTQINIDDITDKLLSSIDYSVYTQYQRCY